MSTRRVTKWLLIVGVLALYAGLSQVVSGEELDAGSQVTAWALGGEGIQELRVGYEGLLPDIEVAFGALHKDAAEPEEQEWPVRGYVIAHALDASMVASALGTDFTLPEGNLYAGLFCEYTRDRADEWSGGYIVGGLVEWPRKWQTVAEYQSAIFNTDQEDNRFMFGLCKRF